MWELYIKIFEQGPCIICKFMLENVRKFRKIFLQDGSDMPCSQTASSLTVLLKRFYWNKNSRKKRRFTGSTYKHNYELNFHCKSLLSQAESDFTTILTAIIKQITALIKRITWLLKKPRFSSGRFLLGDSKKKMQIMIMWSQDAAAGAKCKHLNCDHMTTGAG